jgi:hypothetical protein
MFYLDITYSLYLGKNAITGILAFMSSHKFIMKIYSITSVMVFILSHGF